MTPEPDLTLSCEDLYELVWSKPLAEREGLTRGRVQPLAPAGRLGRPKLLCSFVEPKGSHRAHSHW